MTPSKNPDPSIKGIEARGIDRMAADLGASVVDVGVEQTRRACRLSPEARQRILVLSRLKDDGSRLIEEVEHFRMMSYWDGKQAAMTACIDTLQARIDAAREDVPPLVSIGQGDYRRDIHLCEKCGEEMTFEEGRKAEPEVNAGAIPRGWHCGCGHSET